MYLCEVMQYIQLIYVPVQIEYRWISKLQIFTSTHWSVISWHLPQLMPSLTFDHRLSVHLASTLFGMNKLLLYPGLLTNEFKLVPCLQAEVRPLVDKKFWRYYKSVRNGRCALEDLHIEFSVNTLT